MEHFIWNVNPNILELGPLQLRWYGLLFVGSFFLGLMILTKIYKHEGKDPSVLDAMLIYVMAGAVLGSRLVHCFFYEPEFYLSHPLEILKIWKGGLASHGAAIGIIFAIYLFSSKKKNYSMLWVLDRVVIVVALAGTFIRLGNLFNSEIIGIPTDVAWAFIFYAVDDLPRHPAQLYESIAYFIIFIVLWFVYYKGFEKNKSGLLFGLFLVFIFTFRFFVSDLSLC